MDCIQESLNRTDGKAFKENKWGARHVSAWMNPRGQERAIVGLFKSAADYADTHKERFESPVGKDGVLHVGFLQIIGGIRVFLNGELGRLDGGTLDALLFAMLKEAGFNEQDIDGI